MSKIGCYGQWIWVRRSSDLSCEFAGRVSAKVMQTALAVREVVLTFTEVVIGMGTYMLTILALTAGLDAWLMLPFAGWALAYGAACWYFVPRLGRVGQEQADARSVMTGRVTDAYTNIITVKLFSHSRREAAFARQAMDEFKLTGQAQMRLITGFEIVNHPGRPGACRRWHERQAAIPNR